MGLPSGTKLGPYEIVAPLGAGGMGEVYRARDPRLERSVAIKILPAHLAWRARRWRSVSGAGLCRSSRCCDMGRRSPKGCRLRIVAA